MSRAVSISAMQAMHDAETDDYEIILLTVHHPGLDEPIRVSTDATQRIRETAEDIVYGTISNGDEYVFVGIDIALPSQSEDSPPETRITIDNIDPAIVEALRSISGSPEVDIAVVMYSSPDEIQVYYPSFTMPVATFDEMTVTGALTLDMMMNEPAPGDVMGPKYFPGQFK